MLGAMNVRVIMHGAPPPSSMRARILVANHVSWLDIHAINSIRAVRFVSKAEVRQWPVIGWLAHHAGTVFINREKRHEAVRMVDTANAVLQENDTLCVFPEGTTTDGTEIRPFKGGILQAAIDTGIEVWPVAISYPNTDGTPNREMAYHGDTSLLESFRLVLSQHSPVVELHFLEAISPHQHNRQSLAAKARESIAVRLGLQEMSG